MAGFNDPNFCQPMTFKLNFPSFCFVLFLVSERRWMINAYMHTMPGQIRKKNSDK